MFLEKFTPLAKIFTLPAAVTAVTNLTSDMSIAQIALDRETGKRGKKCTLPSWQALTPRGKHGFIIGKALQIKEQDKNIYMYLSSKKGHQRWR